MSRKVLGKGLSALIPDKPIPVMQQGTEEEGVRELPVASILPNPHQPRKEFTDEGMADLVRSVRNRGVIQPVLVRQRGRDFELIAGERRWRAAQQAGIVRIPALIRKVSEQDSLELALIENLQRENLNPMEAAESYDQLMREFHLTQEEVARKLGKQRSSVANALRFLSLPEELKGYLRRSKLTAGHAKALLSLSSASQQLALGREIIRKGLSVRETEKRVRKDLSGKKEKAPGKKTDVHVRAMEEALRRGFGTKVRIHDHSGRGKIEITYTSSKERERLITLLRETTHP
ncbi:MAG: ParB/RepB/Spo0J family partition protein [Deltaproteobacteria bacterium]|nr:ParB/RepB/Spo0J family partition protein [Deltaproteobacteria bacterium]